MQRQRKIRTPSTTYDVERILRHGSSRYMPMQRISFPFAAAGWARELGGLPKPSKHPLKRAPMRWGKRRKGMIVTSVQSMSGGTGVSPLTATLAERSLYKRRKTLVIELTDASALGEYLRSQSWKNLGSTDQLFAPHEREFWSAASRMNFGTITYDSAYRDRHMMAPWLQQDHNGFDHLFANLIELSRYFDYCYIDVPRCPKLQRQITGVSDMIHVFNREGQAGFYNWTKRILDTAKPIRAPKVIMESDWLGVYEKIHATLEHYPNFSRDEIWGWDQQI